MRSRVRKVRKPLDRSDVISIISLVVALFGTLFSGIFTLLAQQTAEEANRIARESSNPVVEVGVINTVADIAITPCITHDAPGEEKSYQVNLFIEPVEGVTITNNGGRSVSLLSVAVGVLGTSQATPTVKRGEDGRVVIPDSEWRVSAWGHLYKGEQEVELPQEIPPGASRIWELRAFPMLGRVGDEEYTIKLMEAANQSYQFHWIFNFNNGESVHQLIDYRTFGFPRDLAGAAKCEDILPKERPWNPWIGGRPVPR